MCRVGGVCQILLFNCMPERDPATLLPPLVSVLRQHGVVLHRAFVVPPLSSYTSVGPHKSPASAPIPPTPNHTWQLAIQKSWEGMQSHATCADAFVTSSSPDSPPPTDFVAAPTLFGDDVSAPHADVSSAVLPSLPAALESLRRCVRDHPPLRLQVG